MPDGTGGAAPGLPAVAALAAELCDLKRVRDASAPDSLASRLFRRGWARLAAGEDPEAVALGTTADALAAARLGGIDAAVLAAAGIGPGAARTVLGRSFDEVSGAVAPALRDRLRARLGEARLDEVGRAGTAPDFAERLIRQPRAGATCPGKPRLVLEPPEGHGDHCLVVAVLAVVLSARYGADPAPAFLAGMAHHLHNATLPDSGFAGEVLLGDQLEPVMATLFARELATLPAPLAADARAALDAIREAATPVGRAFHAADVMDRVLEMRHFARVAAFTVDQALDDLHLVHAGPVQAFHHDVLREAGLP